jgi:hypothetical protein
MRIAKGTFSSELTVLRFHMAEPAPHDVRDIFDHAWDSAQCLAIDVIEFPEDKRDAVMHRMGTVLIENANEADCPHEMAHDFGAAMEKNDSCLRCRD